MLSLDWIAEHHDEFDVFHVQFGFDAQDPANLDAVAVELARLGKPLVYTVHDLRNPHHASPEAHDAHLDVLMRRADALITLTSGAARTIEARWGRQPSVVPHPHVVDFDRMGRDRPSREGFVIGLHAKSVRASMSPLPVIETLQKAVAALPGARLIVDIHHDVFDEGSPNRVPALADHLASSALEGSLELQVHDCYSDAELWDYLQGLDVSVLPYRFGTHSGWLEACFDLGTSVIAPDCGFFADQRPCLSYGHDERRLDRPSLEAAVRVAYEDRPQWRANVDDRRREREDVAAAHHSIYAQLLR